MTSTRSRIAIALALVLALACGAYWYFSPWLTIRALHAAAEARDFQQLNPHVDYPRLRESVKAQLNAALGQRLQGSRDNPLGGLAGAMGSAVIGGLVETLVRPVTLMTILRAGRIEAPAGAGAGSAATLAPAQRSGAAAEPAAEAGEGRDWRVDRIGASRVIVFPKTEPQDPGYGVVLDRSGFATWTVTGLRLPPRLLGGSGPGS